MRVALSFLTGGAFFIGVLLSLAFMSIPQREAAAPKEVREEKRLRYRVTLRNRTGEVVKRSEVRVFAPVLRTASQITLDVTASRPYERLSDPLGNQVLRFLVTVPPYGTKVLSIAARVHLHNGYAVSSLVDDPMEYLAEEQYVELSYPPLIELAEKLRAPSPIQTVEQAVQWISSHIKSEGYIRDDRGARWALDNLTGDCTERSYLLIALLRRNEIPARMVGGFVIEEDAVLNTRAYHNWVEYHDGGVWRITDVDDVRRGEDPFRYVAFRVIARGEASPLSNSQRFAAFDERLEMQLN